MKTLPIFYLPPISWFSHFLSTEDIVLEKFENFPKQTYRNRANIYGANGKLSLIIPIQHTGARIIKDIKISETENWRKLHFKSIKNAYQSSPYFEFYEDEISKIFENRFDFLVDFNLNALESVQKLLKTEREYSFTDKYVEIDSEADLRKKFSPKVQPEGNEEPYYQVFADKMSFLPDLSIIDLLCNKGPESVTYIKNIVK